MTNLWRVRGWVLIPLSILITVVLGFMALGACGVGHGDCTWIIYFFPLMGLIGLLPATDLVGGYGILLGLLQFPLYAVILNFGIRKQRTKAVAIGLIAFHVVAVMIIVFVFD